jgi:hypothetical protein
MNRARLGGSSSVSPVAPGRPLKVRQSRTGFNLPVLPRPALSSAVLSRPALSSAGPLSSAGSARLTDQPRAGPGPSVRQPTADPRGGNEFSPYSRKTIPAPPGKSSCSRREWFCRRTGPCPVARDLKLSGPEFSLVQTGFWTTNPEQSGLIGTPIQQVSRPTSAFSGSILCRTNYDGTRPSWDNLSHYRGPAGPVPAKVSGPGLSGPDFSPVPCHAREGLG